MKAASESIKECLASQATESCDLYTLTLADGTVYRFASYSADVTYNNLTYDHSKFIFKRQQLKLAGAPSVDTLGITVYCSVDDMLGDVTFMQACHNGMLEDSSLLLSRAYFADGECVGVLPLFSGRCEVNQSGGLAVKLNVKSIIQGLAAPLPVRMFAAQAAYANANGVIVVSENDTTSMVIPLKPSGNVLVRM